VIFNHKLTKNMPAKIERIDNNTFLLRLSGLVKRAEFGVAQDRTAVEIDAGAKPRILALLDGFAGFERGADWGDLEFLFSHSNEIARIAIVGDPNWETETLAFAGAGFRKAPVKFFPPDQEKQAREWLAS
jgi:hypothetical protein